VTSEREGGERREGGVDNVARRWLVGLSTFDRQESEKSKQRASLEGKVSSRNSRRDDQY
jgi:hypothetical protein